jgi:iron complex transport system permease protein
MTDKRKRLYLFLLLSALIITSVVSLLSGRYPRPGLLSPGLLFQDPLSIRLLISLRLPRVLAAVILGASLGAAGLSFQMLFANPLVEPGFLGVSQGSAFGAALAIVFFSGREWLIQVSSFSFAVLGLFLAFYLAHRIRYGGWVLRLILSGISVSALFTAGLGVLKYSADPLRELPEITFWLLGGLWGVTWGRLLSILPLCIPALLLMYLLRWRLNALSLNDEIIHSLGIAPKRERILILGSAVAATAAVISLAGIVGWVGLIVPHISRRLFNVNSRFSLPGAMLIGALFTLLCDDGARIILAGEIPLGIITSFLGAIVFLLLMITKKVGRHGTG